MSITDTIGKKLRALRLSKGLTQEELAFRLGISLPAYSKIERGITDVNISRLEQISIELGVKPKVFFEEYRLGDDSVVLSDIDNKELYLVNTIRDKEEIIILQRKYIEQLESK